MAYNYQNSKGQTYYLHGKEVTLQNDRKVELYPYQTNSWWYFGFNEKNRTFADNRVRDALTRMVDVDALLQPIGTGDRISGPFVPSSPFYNHDVKPIAFDPGSRCHECDW